MESSGSDHTAWSFPRTSERRTYLCFTQAANRFISDQRFSKHGTLYEEVLSRTFVLIILLFVRMSRFFETDSSSSACPARKQCTRSVDWQFICQSIFFCHPVKLSYSHLQNKNPHRGFLFLDLADNRWVCNFLVLGKKESLG